MATPTAMSDPIYNDEDAARAHLEALRWPNGVTCPHCGSTEAARPVGGNSMGPGWYYCGDCKDKFTVRTGTVYERSHIPLHKWMLGFRMMASSKKGVSAHQLHRTLGIHYRSAWFLAHRIREAMKESDPAPLGGPGKIVEVDEVYVGKGNDRFVSGHGWQKGKGKSGRATVVTLVERGGKARSVKVENLTPETVNALLDANVDKASVLNTDEAHVYKRPGKKFAGHDRVNHSKGEYAKADGTTTNSVEGFFSIFRRGMVGVYQHCGEQHLARYVTEFDFRYSNRAALGVDDAMRTEIAVKGAEGKRLTLRRPNGKQAA